jgi:hypothetical protein
MERILLEEPVDPRKVRSDVPRDLALICTKALEKRRERRYASMVELRDVLNAHLAGLPIAATPPSGLARTSRLVRRHPSVATAAAAVLVGLGIGVLFSRGGDDGASRGIDAAGAALASSPRGTVVRQVWSDADDLLCCWPPPSCLHRR